MSAAPSGAAVRAGVEIVIGNMCLRQTNQKKLSDEKLALRLCVCCLCQTPKTNEDTNTDAFNSLTNALI